MKKEIRVHPQYGQPGGPPGPSPEWRQDQDSGTWRLPAEHGFRWDRQGIHALMGVLVALLPWGPFWFSVSLPEAMLGALIGLMAMLATVYTFLRYEETEDARIRDHAYRDIGGFMTGFLVTHVCAIVCTLASRILF